MTYGSVSAYYCIYIIFQRLKAIKKSQNSFFTIFLDDRRILIRIQEAQNTYGSGTATLPVGPHLSSVNIVCCLYIETLCVQGPGAEGRGALLHVHPAGLHHLRQGQLPGAAAKYCCDPFSFTDLLFHETTSLLLSLLTFGSSSVLDWWFLGNCCDHRRTSVS